MTEFTVNGKNVDVTSGELTIVCNLLRVTDLSSHMIGFEICEQSKNDITEALTLGIDAPLNICHLIRS